MRHLSIIHLVISGRWLPLETSARWGAALGAAAGGTVGAAQGVGEAAAGAARAGLSSDARGAIGTAVGEGAEAAIRILVILLDIPTGIPSNRCDCCWSSRLSSSSHG
jgi:hypothetical protein